MPISLARSQITSPERSEKTSRIFWAAHLTAGLALLLLAAIEVVRFHTLSKGMALFSGGGLGILAAFALAFASPLSAWLGRPLARRTVLAALALLWMSWITLIAYTHYVEGWDEGAYVLSGMALRGMHVPYAAHRAPITGLLCAVFTGWDRFLNPVLLGTLLVAVLFWVRRLLGPLAAILALFVLLCQNLLLESTVDIMSELPAALLVLGSFYFLSRQLFWWSACCCALVVFCRWNLAPLWAVVVVAVFLRFGMIQAWKFLAAAAASFAAWYVLTISMGASNPLWEVYVGNFLPGLAWAADPSHKPTFLIRSQFYASHFFFLTPLVLIGVVASPLRNLRRHLDPESWTIRVVLPLALLTYLAVMLNMGGLFPRFVTPLIPSAIVSFIYTLCTEDWAVLRKYRLQFVTAAVFVTCAAGVWPLEAVLMVRVNHQARPIFSAGFRNALVALDRNVSLYGVSREPLSSVNGFRAMVEARHVILFPSARRNFNTNIISEPNSVDSVHRLATVCKSGDLLLIPRDFASVFQADAILASDSRWALVRNP